MGIKNRNIYSGVRKFQLRFPKPGYAEIWGHFDFLAYYKAKKYLKISTVNMPLQNIEKFVKKFLKVRKIPMKPPSQNSLL